MGGAVAKAEADTTCQSLHEAMTTHIKAVPGYSILDSSHTCSPTSPNEIDNTDYDFAGSCLLTKPGSDNATGIKANMDMLVKDLPKQDFTVWIHTDSASNGRSDTFCLEATTRVQGEYDEVYNSFVENLTRYTKPDSPDGTYPCIELD